MKKPPLLSLYCIYHGEDERHVRRYVNAIGNAFERNRYDSHTSDLERIPHVQERVHFRAIVSGEDWKSRAWKDDRSIPALFVVIVTEKLVRDPGLRDLLDTIALLIPERTAESNCDLLCYSLSEIAMGQLPGIFGKRQVKNIADLGEYRIAPHKLGLVALHRSRLLLGLSGQSDTLKIFISHAKHDGIFFAHALKNSIEQTPELNAWYDAQDIKNGSDWNAQIIEAASNAVFIAIRTNAYEQRSVCREEFMTAFNHGVPIVVVDALMTPISDSSALPFASVPNVRIPDGNTNRVLREMLREHLRILLLQAAAAEKSPDKKLRVWPRLPSPAAIRTATVAEPDRNCWLLPKALCYDSEFLELRDWLASIGSPVTLEHLETFRPPPTLT